MLQYVAVNVGQNGNQAAGTNGQERQNQAVITAVNGEIFRQHTIQLCSLCYIACCLFDSNNVAEVCCQTCNSFRSNVAAGTSRNIINDNRQLSSLCYGCKMLVIAFLSRFVVVRAYHEHAIYTAGFHFLNQINSAGSTVGTCTGNNLGTAVDTCNDGLHEFNFFIHVHGCSFTGRAFYYQAITAVSQQPVSKVCTGFIIDAAISVERRNHCR